MKRDNIEVNDRQLACARIQSKEGQDYLNGKCQNKFLSVIKATHTITQNAFYFGNFCC